MVCAFSLSHLVFVVRAIYSVHNSSSCNIRLAVRQSEHYVVISVLTSSAVVIALMSIVECVVTILHLVNVLVSVPSSVVHGPQVCA